MALRFPYRRRVKHVHSSSRFDRSAWSLLLAVRWYITLCDIVTFTEMGRNIRVRYLKRIPGWQYVQVESPALSGEDECALLFRKAKWELVSVRVMRLSDLPVPGRGGVGLFALCVVLRHRRSGQQIYVSIAHLPAHVEGRDGLGSEINGQVDVYRDAVNTWAKDASVQRERISIDGVLYVADWNLSWRRAWVRAYMDRHFPGLNANWQGHTPDTGGTHGFTRLIDFTMTNLRVLRSRLVRDDGSSDHRPYVEVLLLPRKAA